MDLEGYKI